MKKTTRTILLGTALLGMSVPAAMASPRGAAPARARVQAPARATARPTVGQRMRASLSRAFRPIARTAGSDAVRPEAAGQIQRIAADMTSTIRQTATPPIALVNTNAGTRMNLLRGSNYKKGITAQYQVQAPGGKLKLTALLPVSGHVGVPQAEGYARTNVYNVEVVHPDGKVERARVNATGMVTEHPISLDLKPGTTLVRAWADGSAGVGGFKSGREIELHYSGN